jgi:hypothetical protein
MAMMMAATAMRRYRQRIDPRSQYSALDFAFQVRISSQECPTSVA